MIRMLSALSLTGLILSATPAWAQVTVETEVDVKPNWHKRPSENDLLAVWPRDALRRGTGGRALLHCKVSAQGALFDCDVVSEAPAGKGFGGAALALAPQFLMSPAMKGGKPVAYDGVGLPITFESASPELGSHIAGSNPQSGTLVRYVSNLPWSKAPTVAEVLAAYPAKARAAGLAGHTSVDCAFRKDGKVEGCEVVSEEPIANGFGIAARALAATFVGPGPTPDGQSLARAHTLIPIVFSVSPAGEAPLLTGKLRWTAGPSVAAFETVFAPIAREMNYPVVRATVGCTVGPAGVLINCETLSEEPADHRIGAAAIGLAGKFSLGLWTETGSPTVGAKVQLPLRYNMPQPAASAAKP